MTRTEKYRKLREELYSSRERAWMKKMKPKRVVYYEGTEMGAVRERLLECPTCSELLSNAFEEDWNYCPFCGQAILMPEEDEC